ncbi:MAG TPA: hypothetical protein VM925_21125 [Labilithrix sp.]|nr:hypothetical protein [Labilithrix sp.]
MRRSLTLRERKTVCSRRLSADFRRIASSLLLKILQYPSSSLLALLGTRRKDSVRKPFFALAFLGALGAGPTARADSLTPNESTRLDRRETVIREQTIDRGEHRWIGGVTYTVMDASAAEVAAVFDNVESLGRVLPRTKSARVVGTTGGDQLLELVQGNALMEARYTIRVRREPGEARFWLDPSRPHEIDDAWGFFRYEAFIDASGEERVLLTYGVLVDVGPGIVRDLFEERVRTTLLSVPQLLRRQVAQLRRPL